MQKPIPSHIASIMRLCAWRGIALAVRNSHLVAGPVDRLTPDLRSALVKHRTALIEHLTRPLIVEKDAR